MNTSTIPLIDICICTYNRTDYLEYCLDALLPQLQQDQGTVVVTILDNAGNTDTQVAVEARKVNYPQLSYVHEPETGLSFARNTAWKRSVATWILYIDDDCLPPTQFLESAIHVATLQHAFDAIGGPVEAVYKGERPEWLPEGFGSFSMPYTELTRVDSGFIRGGCMMIRRSVLKQLEGFATDLGVTPHQLRYGEEIELQLRMRQAGYSIGYAPSLRIGHFVRSDKLSLSWMLRSEYARRRDKMRIEPLSIVQSTMNLLRTSAGRLVRLPAYVFRMVWKRGNDSRKISFDYFRPMAYRLGEWVGSMKGRS